MRQIDAFIRLKLDLDDTLPPILANRALIQRVLVNLLTNAIESLADTRGFPPQLPGGGLPAQP